MRRFLDTATANRELLVSLIERVELTQEKNIIIKFRFRRYRAIFRNNRLQQASGAMYLALKKKRSKS